MAASTDPSAPHPPVLPYRGLILRSILLGAFAGTFGIIYLGGVNFLTERIWGDDWATAGWFSGTVWSIAIPVVAGVLVGLVYRTWSLPPRFPGFVDDLREGEVDPHTTPAAVGIAVISLISGPSVGPEAPMGAAGGALGTWLGRRRGGDPDEVRQLTFIGISGAFGGMLGTPIGGPLLAFELEHDQTSDYYYTNLVPGVIAGAVAFGIMWPVLGAPFGGLLALPHDAFASWMLLVAVALGVVGAAAAFAVGRTMVSAVSIMKRLDGRPVLRGAIAGLIVGLITYTLPLTAFSGQTALPHILDDVGGIAIPTLLALALLKAVSLGVSVGGGFFGGPIFPLFFIGAVLGIVVHLVFPAIPIALAVGCVMAALGAAIAMLPLSMAILTVILIDSSLEVFAAVALSSVTAFAIRMAIVHSRRGDMQRTVSAKGTGE